MPSLERRFHLCGIRWGVCEKKKPDKMHFLFLKFCVTGINGHGCLVGKDGFASGGCDGSLARQGSFAYKMLPCLCARGEIDALIAFFSWEFMGWKCSNFLAALITKAINLHFMLWKRRPPSHKMCLHLKRNQLTFYVMKKKASLLDCEAHLEPKGLPPS